MRLIMKSLSIGVAVSTLACTMPKQLPPALPEEPTIQIPYAWQEPEKAAPVQVAPGAPPPPPPSMEPLIQPSAEELGKFSPGSRGKKPPKQRTSEPAPEVVVDQANRQGLLGPSRRGYGYSTSVSQRYPLWFGRLFEVYTAPSHPTTIRLPAGELLAKGFKPTLDPEKWNVGIIEQGLENPFHAIVIRPMAAGQEATTPLLLQSGKALFCRIRSFEKTSMVEVTWEDEQPVEKPMKAAGAMRVGTTNARQAQIPPAIPGDTRVHTAYTITKIGDHTPAWMPSRVWDDGTTTYILFKESLQFTNAPAVFGRTTEKGSPHLVQFTAWEEQGKASYIVRGLWPLIELKGDGMTVHILRGPTRGQTHVEN